MQLLIKTCKNAGIVQDWGARWGKAQVVEKSEQGKSFAHLVEIYL